MNWYEDAYFLRLPSGSPTQGDIWSNLPVPISDQPFCTGIVITPRCDLAHDKSPFINYLPLVTMDDLLECHGGFVLLEQELQRRKQSLRNAAEHLNVSELLEIGFPPEEIFDRLIEDPEQQHRSNPKHFNQQVDSLREHAATIDKIQVFFDKPRLRASDIAMFVSRKALAKYKLDVVRNTVADLHFLPPCPPLLLSPSVILIRYIVTCSVDLLLTANGCVSQSEWDRVRARKSTIDFGLSRTQPERLLRLKSPYLEALMCRFGALFSRVGTRDFQQDQLDAFVQPLNE
ncbi:MAG: hypothetical protein MN733_03690 [Nitrososphaera sp.]|nr:hypothetical protein [Nitrososphaera sp.]